MASHQVALDVAEAGNTPSGILITGLVRTNEDFMDSDAVSDCELGCIDLDNSDPLASSDPESRHIILLIQNRARLLFSQHRPVIKKVVLSLAFLGFLVYFAFAVRHSVDGAMALIVISSLVGANIVYEWIKRYHGNIIYNELLVPMACCWDRHWPTVKWFVYPAMVMAVLLYLVFDVIEESKQLQSLAGMALFFFLPWLTSKYPKQINWRTVMWGMALQFLIGCLVLRWVHGYNAVKFLSQELNKFLAYSLQGGAKVFGDPTFVLHPFAMIVVPLVVYLGCVMSILYYFGAIQWVAIKLGWLMSVSLQTTAIESISLVVNIFLSVVDVVLMMRKYIPNLTESEFHCFLVAAHSTIAGFAFGLFVLFGVNAQHLMTGAVMSAPAAVAFAKLNFPETEQTKYKTDKDLQLGTGEDVNFIDAGVRGGWEAAVSVGEILIQTIAFISLIMCVDAALSWFFARVGVELDIATLIGYIFMPFAFLMGVDWDDTLTVGRLIGLKVTANEFLAYFDLGIEIRKGNISARSAAIATYAMCGFSSFGTLVIFAGVWQEVDPKRVEMATSQIPRIMLNANISCFMTACIASLLYTEDVVIDTPTEIEIIGDMARWFMELIPKWEDIQQALIDFMYTSEL